MDNIDGELETTGFKILLATAVCPSQQRHKSPRSMCGSRTNARQGALSFMTSAQSAFADQTDPARQSRINV